VRGSDQAPDSAAWPVKRAPARPGRGGELCAEPARRPNWRRAVGATFLIAIAAGLPATLAAGNAAAASSTASVSSGFCGANGFVLSALPGQSAGEVSLSWCEPVGDPDAPYGDYIEQGTSQGRESATVSTSPYPLPENITTYDVTGLTGGMTYYFVIKAVNRFQKSVTSTEAWATAPTGTSDGTGSPLLGPPTGLSASAGDSQVTLTWTAPASDGGAQTFRYYVYQGSSQGGESSNAVATSTDTTATITDLTNGSPYYFYVKAVNDAAEISSPSNEVRVVPTTGSTSGGSTSGGSTSGGSTSGGSTSGGSTSGGSTSGGSTSGGGNRSGGSNGSGGNVTGGSSHPASSPLVPAISSGVGILVLVGSVIAVRRLRVRPRPPSAPQPSVRVAGDAGPRGGVHVRPTGTQPTVAVRIEPQPGTSTMLIEEMQR
jgi:hypothetical protein